jgi:serine/threonine protein kinase
VLDWDSGQYSFEEREERLEGELPSEIDVPEVLLAWARGARSAEMVRRVLEDGKAVLHRAEKLSARLSGLRLSTAEQWVLDQANGVYSAAEIAAQCPMGEAEGLRASCGLYLAGILELGPTQAPSAATQAFLPPNAAPGVGTGLWDRLEAERDDIGQTTRLATRLPQALGRYVVEQAIGRGSMGAVLLARDPAIDRRVAVKLIQTSVQLTPAEWEKYKERFYREARAAGKLLHQGIVAIFDVGHTVEGIPFIVMEYVEGRTLAALAQDKELPLEQVLRLSRECLDALEYAHAQGVIHRDLKPANIMITADGRPKIMDFGVAHVVGSQMTQADEILGSPHFMAPEQLGKGKVDQRTDLFAFGVVLYWMLTGQLPFTGDSFAAIAQAVLSERPVSPKDLKRHVSRPLGKIVLRCLEKDPAKRFATASDLRKALRAIEEPPRDSRRSVILGLVLLAAVGWLLVFLNRMPASPPEAAAQHSAAAAPMARPAPRATPTATPTTSPTATPGALETAAAAAAPPRGNADEDAFRRSLPLAFAAKHSHRIGSCAGTLRLEDWGVEFRSREHDPWRWRFAEIRELERENERSLHLEAGGKDFNFSFVGKAPADADWARYRKLARK